MKYSDFFKTQYFQVLQQLPSKVDVIEKVSMAFEQADLYEDLKNSFTKKIKSESKDGVVSCMYI